MRPRNSRARFRTSATTGAIWHSACVKRSWSTLFGSLTASFLHPRASRKPAVPMGIASLAPEPGPAKACPRETAGARRSAAPWHDCRCSLAVGLPAKSVSGCGSPVGFIRSLATKPTETQPAAPGCGHGPPAAAAWSFSPIAARCGGAHAAPAAFRLPDQEECQL